MRRSSPKAAETLPPHSPEAERGILACLLSGANLAEVTRAGLCSGWLYDLRHRKVYDAIAAVVREGAVPDLATVGSKLDLEDGWALLEQIEREATSPANAPYWLDILREKALLRSAHQAEAILRQIVTDGSLTPQKLVAEVENALCAIRQATAGHALPPLQTLADLPSKQRSDPDELLQYRFLCRGGGLLLAGPTGIGKSAFGLQAAILWALDRPAFGIHPARPLRSLIVQAENDPGDVGEMRDGTIAGLELSEADAAKACQAIMVAREDTRTGPRFFCEVIEPLLSERQYDLLWIDPALAYLGGETNSQRDVGGFLRNGLNPLLHRYAVGSVVTHHTSKPPTGQEKSKWTAGDFAYLGTGSAEWANWARGVLAIRSIGSHQVYELRAGKRGSRLGWKEADGSTAYARYIAHSTQPGVICWHELDARDVETGGRPKSYDPAEILALLPDAGLATEEWAKLAASECGISKSTFHRERRLFCKAGRIAKSKISDKWQPIKTP